VVPVTDRAREFEALRPELVRVAYATLGSVADAEDVVQEAWLRLQRSAPAELRDLRAWLLRVVGRLALDVLGSARARRERYTGEWLPEPVVEVADDPAERATLGEAVSVGLLRVLEQLSPAERCAFVLHDVFGVEFAEVAAILGRSPDAARQLASRARRRVRDRRPRFPATAREQQRVVTAFALAVQRGDLEALLAVLDPAVVYRVDGGGVVTAARHPLEGADRVARALLALARKGAAGARGALVGVNGAPGLLVEAGGERSVVAFTLDGGRIAAIDIVRNPDKLRAVPALAS
jgi:RNA polymerase sigma-70 factor (ECF subfamily)